MTSSSRDAAHQPERIARAREFYQRYAPRYDHETSYYDRFLLGDGRAWVCSRARGAVLEVAIGTGRNLPFYPRDVRLVGIDLTPAMLAIARDRARGLRMDVTLVEGDAQALPFLAHSFDTVVRASQRLFEKKSLAIAGDHQTRQPVPALRATGFTIERQERSRAGIIQRIIAVKPAPR